MSEHSDLGVLYTEHSALKSATPLASLWSYEVCQRSPNRPAVVRRQDGGQEYWLDRSDPLLNTILPGTGVSLVVNFGDPWAAGRSLASSALLPRVCVIGPVTQARLLIVGNRVRAIGAGLSVVDALRVFGVPASALVDRIVSLAALWTPGDVDRLLASIGGLDVPRCLEALRDQLMARMIRPTVSDPIGDTVTRLISIRRGRVSVDEMARRHGLTRQQFARRFRAVAGLSPKLFARITRFQALVHVLLSTEVSRWSSVAPAIGFYDQAHMINEFRTFAGAPPTVFFQPHGRIAEPGLVRLRGRPSEWLDRDDSESRLARQT